MQCFTNFSDLRKKDDAIKSTQSYIIFISRTLYNLFRFQYDVINTDNFDKEYRCATALNYLSMLNHKYFIIIDRTIGAIVHGNNVVVGMNTIDKK